MFRIEHVSVKLNNGIIYLIGGDQMESPNENVWFYIRDHQQQGPVGFFELRKMFEQRVLTGDTFLWTKEIGYWQMAKTLNLFPELILKIEQGNPHLENLAATWTEVSKETYPQGRPFVRYLARFFDLSLCSVLLITITSIFFPKFITDFSGITIFILSIIAWILLEPFMLTVFGTTLGKALVNTKLRTVDGEPIDFSTAFQRSIFVNAAGMGLGLPLINFICFCFSYFDLKRNGLSTWDRQIGTVVLYGKVSVFRLVLASLFPIGLLIAGFIIY
jgi:uncharacterized RDD family membrane protein YckC